MPFVEDIVTSRGRTPVEQAEWDLMLETSRINRESSAAMAIANLSFAWEVLVDDANREAREYIAPYSPGSITPITKEFGIRTDYMDVGVLSKVTLGIRLPATHDLDGQIEVSGSKAKDMRLIVYRGTHADGVSYESQLGKDLTKLSMDGERMFTVWHANALVKYLRTPAHKRAALQRYHSKRGNL